MTNLVDSFLGKERFYSKCNGSFFEHPEHGLCVVFGDEDMSGSSTPIKAKSITYNNGKLTARSSLVEIPKEFFVDMSVFQTPDLGWRTTSAGKMLFRVSKNTSSYHRGTSQRNLNIETSDFTTWLMEAGLFTYNSSYLSQFSLADAVMRPKFYSIREGLAKCVAGEIASFAVNGKVAIYPANEANTFVVKYKDITVGLISAEGEMSFSHKYIESLI